MNWTGLIIGAATFITIGTFHPLVIKAEYYFGKKSWVGFLFVGILAMTLSLFTENETGSIILGVVAFSAFWGIGEILQQHERVKRGWFPMNPKRKAEYEK